MKGIITGLLLSAVPQILIGGLGAQRAYADEPQAKENVYVVHAQAISGGEDGKPIVITTEGGDNLVWTTNDTGNSGNAVWVSTTAVGDDDGRSDGKTGVVRIERKISPEEANKGWLGVMIDGTRGKDDQGDRVVTITKVLDGSPAQAAGIQDGDVIYSIDGDLVEGDVSRSVDLIKSKNAGDDVEIVVLRDGVETPVTATLGSRADAPATLNLITEKPIQGAIEDSIVTRGKMLKRDADGNWVVTELGDLSELKDLPDNIKMFIPEAGSQVIELQGDGENQTITININRDGESITIKREDGGDIVVTRTDANGEKTETTYADEDELQAGDEEAYELLGHSGKHGTLRFFGSASDLDPEDFVFDKDGNEFLWKFDADDFDGNLLEWKQQLEKSLGDADEHYEEALDKVQALLEKLDEGEGLGAIQKLHKFRPLHTPQFDGAGAYAFMLGKPAYSFEVRPDGTIAATLRKGDTEVVQVFTGEDDMANRKPELYEKYHKTLEDE